MLENLQSIRDRSFRSVDFEQTLGSINIRDVLSEIFCMCYIYVHVTFVRFHRIDRTIYI